MKSLIIDAQIAGASGDMFLSALLDLVYSDDKKKIDADKKRKNLLLDIATKITLAEDLKEKASLDIDLIRKNVAALEGINLKITLKEPNRHLKVPQAHKILENIFKQMKLSDKAQEFSKRALDILFDAESKVHGESLENVHLHEAGSLDTFLDIIGSAYLLDQLELFDAKIFLLPVALGSGTVTFSHGTLPVPAPAVTEIVKQYKIPVHSGTLKGELLTPTGAILIASLLEISKGLAVKECPYITINHIGIGFGNREYEKTPNALRLILGKELEEKLLQEEIAIIETNIDDCSGETIGFLSQRLLDMGAKDVYLTPIYMKKGRPGTKISVLCNVDETKLFSTEIMNQTSTIGVRIINSTKIMFKREIKQFKVEIKGKTFTVRGKIAYNTKGEVAHFKPEFDDVKIIIEETGLTSNEVVSITRREIAKKL